MGGGRWGQALALEHEFQVGGMRQHGKSAKSFRLE